MKKLIIVTVLCLSAFACATQPSSSYFDQTGRTDVWTGGARLIPITTPKGTFHVWTKRVGNNPRIKVLLLHGGPAMTHEYLEAFDSFLPAAGIEFYYYDQLGSFYSDQPDDEALRSIPRFVDEVEQVRQALGLTSDNFYLYGHSWGGILAMEYALAHPDRLKGLIISNAMSSIPAYNRYAEDVLMPAMDQAALAEVKRIEAAKDYQNPRYMELLMPNHYAVHLLRKPFDQWPEPVTRAIKHLNPAYYIPMQGPSELGVSGLLETWDRSKDLGRITVPTLIIGARYDTMDPKHMRWMATQMKSARYLELENAGHLAMYDEQEPYFRGLIAFLRDVDQGALRVVK